MKVSEVEEFVNKGRRAQTAADILAELYEQKCRCGRKKTAGVTFCRWCIAKLTRELHAGLLAGGAEYAEAYRRAVAHLDELKAKQGKK